MDEFDRHIEIDSVKGAYHRYHNGECHNLAIALHRLTGADIIAVANDAFTIHVGVEHTNREGTFVDVSGVRPAEEVLTDYRHHYPDAEIIHITPEDLRSDPHLHDATKQEREGAQTVAQEIATKLNMGS